ncbi:quinone-dependent dihydroorotate dehydrogenase [Pollutibacter soli]|uniref:quinone-dependent dihydroorotate dehydrogenase n=1 Tax=Pollutibacter soli TaxID=3034157 RepID=UPI0030135521
MYQFIRKCLFFFDPEKVHYFSMDVLGVIAKIPFGKKRLQKSFDYKADGLSREVFGLHFKNPVGLAAGFDKNALYLNELDALGFGFVEIGTVTPLPQEGNEKPRLFRLPGDKAIINRMGFNNFGVKAVVEQLKKWKLSRKKSDSDAMIIGGNIGKNKVTSNEEAWRDYETCFIALYDYVDYFVVNVSSPNTPGLRELQEKESLRKILSHLQAINRTKISLKPLLLKISPDLSERQLNDIVDLAMELQLDGIVATNTTVSREKLSSTPPAEIEKIGAGGLSGKPVKERSDEVVRYIHSKTKGKIPVIGSGGIFTAEDAKDKFNAGAELIQVWTGFIYEGPAIAKNICKGLVK